MDIVEFQRYNILLKRLTSDKIELVRHWRNDPKISQYMEYRDYITPEMQENWFKKINNDHNYYFIVIYSDEEIGMVNIKDIDFVSRCGESGIFIYNDKYLNTDVGFRGALCNADFAFENLKLEYLYGHIMASNKRAIRFNKILGNILDKDQDGKEKQRYILTRDRYFESRERVVKLFPESRHHIPL
jgi:RimJ/RimL family protein N-acetyltransferase